MHTYRRLFKMAADMRGFFSVISSLSILLTGVIIFQMYILSRIINEIFFESAKPPTVWIILLLISILLRGVLIWVKEGTSKSQAVKIKSGLKQQLFHHIIDLGYGFSRDKKIGSLISPVSEGTEKIETFFSNYVPALIHIIILPVSVIIFTLIYDWMSGLIMLITAPLIIFFMYLIGTYARKLTNDQWGQLSKLSSHFLDTLQGLKTIKTFGSELFEIKQVFNKSNSFRMITMEVLKVAFLSGLVLELAASISIAMVALQIGVRLIEGMISYQPALFVLLLAPEFYLPFRLLGAHHHSAMEGVAAAEDVFNILDEKIRLESVGSTTSMINKSPEIEIKNVCFSYPDSAQSTLKNINCIIPGGKLTALIGESGSGKSTFINILLGFLEANSGEIFIDNNKLTTKTLGEWQQSIGLVSQSPHFFNGTIKQNLLHSNHAANEKDIHEASLKGGSYDFIMNLPNGYHTVLNDNASILSGGEKQRLAITRAFLKNAPFLILDEPTSNLDPESEYFITQSAEIMAKNATTVVIAHRLNTILKADKILVFKEGRIVESGRHKELYRMNGIYTRYIKTNYNKDSIYK